MEATTEGGATSGTVLGAFEVTLQADPGGSTYATTTQVTASTDGVAREVALSVGALLFAQRQMRSVNDPARIAAVDDVAASCAAARENRLVLRALGGSPRSLATYRIELLANGSFRINVEQRLAGMLHDSAGSLTTGALAAELLTTLAEPYRTFYREMLEAAQVYWRDRRPSAVESTWEWGIALSRLNQLVRQGVAPQAAPEVCHSCKALRPAGSACLRCGAPPSLAQTLRSAAPTVPLAPQPTPAVPETSVAAPPNVSQPGVSTLGITVTKAVTPPPPPPAPPVVAPPAEQERTILPARDAPLISASEAPSGDDLPLASLPQRAGAWLIDIVSGGVVAAIGAIGLTSILLATDTISTTDNPQQVAATLWVLFLGLYLVLGWLKGETLGMLALRLKLVRSESHAPIGLGQSLLRGIGSLLLVALGVGAIVAVVALDLALPFVQGMADYAMRIAAVIIGLYIIWSGSGQRILTANGRQTLSDKIAGTLVVRR
jgi:uncharacterized RDD family membrane protein YckC